MNTQRKPQTLKNLVEEKLEIFCDEFQKVINECRIMKMSLADMNKEAHRRTAYIKDFIINCPSYRLYIKEKWRIK